MYPVPQSIFTLTRELLVRKICHESNSGTLFEKLGTFIVLMDIINRLLQVKDGTKHF